MSRRQWRTEDPGVLQSMGSQNQTWLNDWTTTCKTISFTFYFFLSNLDAVIIFFSCIILLARTSSTMLNRCGENRHPYFVSWRRSWQPTPAFLPGKSHGQRYLVGYSPWGCKELDMTEWLHSLTQFVSYLRGKAFSLSPLSMMLTMYFLCMAFIMLR